MTRSDLITTLASHFSNLMAKDAEIAVKEILDAIGNPWYKVIASKSVASVRSV